MKRRTELHQLLDEGYTLPLAGDLLDDFAPFSLKIALKAYFSTYEAIKNTLLLTNGIELDPKTFRLAHDYSYVVAYAESIIHFQHFIELIIKELMRKEHPLLACGLTKKPDLLFRILKGEIIEKEEIESLPSIEFTESLERICTLISMGRLNKSKLQFIVDARSWLGELNKLRNRLLHRGIFFLTYPALDELVGRFILPFAIELISLPLYRNCQREWKYQPLSCGLDPIELIINEWKSDKYNAGKIALLKELARASYENPLIGTYPTNRFNRTALHMKRMAQSESKLLGMNPPTKCPVCGLKALVVYDHTAGKQKYKKLWAVKCMCCSFEIIGEIGNPSEHNLPIDDFI